MDFQLCWIPLLALHEAEIPKKMVGITKRLFLLKSLLVKDYF